MRINRPQYKGAALGLVAGLSLAFWGGGCTSAGAQAVQTETRGPDGRRAAGGPSATPDATPVADAGIPVTQPEDPTGERTRQVALERAFARRTDPFALSAAERAFDAEQRAARLLADLGGFSVYFELPEEPADRPPRREPPPLWRLSGVILGDAVIALLVREEGRPAQLLTPGTRIEGTDWRVVSIDTERAVLRRSGDVEPKEISVFLQDRMPSPAAAQPGGGAPGAGQGEDVEQGGGGGAGGQTRPMQD